ncbi:hypothetical protein HU735_10865 [Pseudomonas sp. BW16M2]|uniref:hypothetical protein n=1 Tax=Pseudomonas sp. BW16M2 TaxID=2745489 RepID=UPI0016446C22|nr:hypothetical protein [Pseudomonas sp. BW16M2]MBC3435915.1 hypothetical protein [Pseudomonas sp. BW16M2]
MMWPIASPPICTQSFEGLHIVEVLYDFDGPKIFTTLGSGVLLYFWYESEEDREEQLIRYLVTPASPSQIQQLKAGYKSVHDLLKQNWLWVVDMHYDLSPSMAWRLESLDDVPTQFKPPPHATLCPKHLHIPASTQSVP